MPRGRAQRPDVRRTTQTGGRSGLALASSARVPRVFRRGYPPRTAVAGAAALSPDDRRAMHQRLVTAQTSEDAAPIARRVEGAQGAGNVAFKDVVALPVDPHGFGSTVTLYW